MIHSASHRHRRGVLLRAHRARSGQDLSGGPRLGRQLQDSRDWPIGLVLPRPHARTPGRCGRTHRVPWAAQVHS